MKLGPIGDHELAERNAHVEQSVISCTLTNPWRIISEVGACGPHRVYPEQQCAATIDAQIDSDDASDDFIKKTAF